MPNIQFEINVSVKEAKPNNEDINFTSKKAKINFCHQNLNVKEKKAEILLALKGSLSDPRIYVSFLNLHEKYKEIHYKPHAVITFYKHALISR